MPLISVIIPVYNGEKTIRETIESALNQTFQDFELIVINDGSQDATLEIVEGFQDSRIHIFSYSNAGQAISRNRGFSQSVGEFIAFLDADDLWTPNKLEAQLQALQANPQSAVAYSWTDYIDEFGEFSRRGSHINVSGDVYKNLLMINFLENGSNPLIRRQALTEVGDFEKLLTPAEDWDMWLRLAARYHFVAVPSPQILYRVYAHSSSFNISKLEAGCLQVINRAFAQAPETLQPLKRDSLANLYKYLTSKALEGPPERRRSLVAALFLGQAIRNDPWLLRAGVLLKVLFKIAVSTLLPSQLAQVLLTKVGKLSDIKALHGYLRLDPS
ncbi:MAG TPA: glycosyltransferase [Candidatus Sericytochromatia bacterium]